MSFIFQIKLAIFLAYTIIFASMGKWSWWIAAVCIQLVVNIFWLLFSISKDSSSESLKKDVSEISIAQTTNLTQSNTPNLQENLNWKLAGLCILLFVVLGYLAIPIILLIVSSKKNQSPALNLIFKIFRIISIICAVILFLALAACFLAISGYR